MWSKRFSGQVGRPALRLLAILGWLFLAGIASAQDSAPGPMAPNPILSDQMPPVRPPLPRFAPKLKAVDADHQSVVLNRPGYFCVVIGTSEESQDAARRAGIALYPFQGQRNFQLVVIVDLRGSIAAWAPGLVEERMRASLDHEAIELKPQFLKNGNTSNPRLSSHVVADFSGTVFPLVGWSESSDDLRGILYGPNGREIKRWEPLLQMDQLQAAVRTAMASSVKPHRPNPPGATGTRAP